MNRKSGNVVAIMGATATGKSAAALRLAEKLAGEIISMDSRQVYRGLDVGTAKVGQDERRRVPHHLIDTLDPNEVNSAGRHVELAKRAAKEIASRGKVPILAGGTGLYFRAFFHGLIDVLASDEHIEATRRQLEEQSTPALYGQLSRVDPERARELSENDRLRIVRALEIYLSTGKTHTQHVAEQKESSARRGPRIVLTMPRKRLRERIRARTERMYREGWVDEVRGLLNAGWSLQAPAMNSLGYQRIAEAIVAGEDPYETGERVVTLTQQYAKRQETFFRSVEGAVWIDVTQAGVEERIERAVREGLGL